MLLRPAAVQGWRAVRRYAVPAPMIRRATERRLAGDWRGACAAADVAVELDPQALAARYGPRIAAAVADDLRHLAPDLLRWHLPRKPSTGHTALTPRVLTVLARYGADGPVLCVGGPRTAFARQQLRLFVAEEPLRTSGDPAGEPQACTWYQEVESDAPRHRWDARCAGELLSWYGLDRVPGFDRAANPCGETEPVVYGLHDVDAFAAAWARVGVFVPEQHLRINARLALRYWYRLPEIARAVRRLGAETDRVEAGYGGRPGLVFEQTTAERMHLTLTSPYYQVRSLYLPLEALSVPLDALLLHLGLVPPDHLHPLVHAALFPDAPAPPAGPPPPTTPEPIRVRCQGQWHELYHHNGAVHMPHSDAECRRESTMAALGGTADGCFAVAAAWESGSGRLPRRLREQRRDLMQRALHGDLDGVTALLDAGVDPHVRDHRGRTLLHYLPHLRDLSLLDRLLNAGLDVNAVDVAGQTPLAVAVHGMGSPALVHALLAAGGDPGSLVDWAATARPGLLP